MDETPVPGTPEYRRTRSLKTTRLIRRISWIVFAFTLPCYAVYLWVYVLSHQGVPVMHRYPYVMILHLLAMAGFGTAAVAMGLLLGKCISTARARGRIMSLSEWFRYLKPKWVPAVAFVILLGWLWSIPVVQFLFASADQGGSVVQEDGAYYRIYEGRREQISKAEFDEVAARQSVFMTHIWASFAWITVAGWATAASVELRLPNDETE